MLLIELDLIEYAQCLDIQKRIVRRKILEGGPDVLLILEHPPTVTLGVRGKTSDLLISLEEMSRRRRGPPSRRPGRRGYIPWSGADRLLSYCGSEGTGAFREKICYRALKKRS